MIKPYCRDDAVTLYHGDAATVLASLPAQSVDCIVTSPPYFGLRDYGEDGQIGAEPSPAEFVAALVSVFREARRVLADDGTLWLNLGDSYMSRQFGWGTTTGGTWAARHREAGDERPDAPRVGGGHAKSGEMSRRSGIPRKGLMGIPWRTAIALQDDGWILRNDVIWSKPNGMPDSVTDRLSNRHEHLFLFSKKPRYWFNLDPIREPHTSTPDRAGATALRGQAAMRRTGPNSGAYSEGGRNPGDVWTIATQPFPGAHFATFPPALAERCIQAGCKPGGTVLDPFSGSGTTGLAASRHGMRYVGIDLSRDYLDLSLRTRLAQGSLLTGGAA